MQRVCDTVVQNNNTFLKIFSSVKKDDTLYAVNSTRVNGVSYLRNGVQHKTSMKNQQFDVK